MEKKYIISDTMQSLIDWEHIMPMDRYAGGHDDQMKGLYKGAKVIGHYNENDYQGMVATCVKLPDGRFVIYNDYYGSCSGCDSWESATDDEVRKLCIDLANGSFIFQNLKDVVEYLKAARDETKDISGDYVASYEWQRCGKGLLDEIGQICLVAHLPAWVLSLWNQAHTQGKRFSSMKNGIFPLKFKHAACLSCL